MVKGCLYVAAKNPTRYRGNADDLNPIKRLGIALGYVYTEGFKEWIERPANSHRLFMASGDQPGLSNLRKLGDGSLDGLIEASVVIDYQLLKTGLNKHVIVAGCDTPEFIYVAFGPKNSPGDQLIEQFDKGMAELRSSGKLAEIWRQRLEIGACSPSIGNAPTPAAFQQPMSNYDAVKRRCNKKPL